MAYDQPRHFAHPQHKLLWTHYYGVATQRCDICGSKLAGLVGYRCNLCEFDIHEACAAYFKESISFFAHPWHTLTLSRIPSSSFEWACNLCNEPFLPGSCAYRCVGCMFNVHPLCTMLPQTIRSPFHPEHDLHMVPAIWGKCIACCEDLPVWHYVCGGSCLVGLHIACASGEPWSAGENTDSNMVFSKAQHQEGSTSSQSALVKRPSRSSRVAKFLLKQAFVMAINAATGGLATPVLHVLAGAGLIPISSLRGLVAVALAAHVLPSRARPLTGILDDNRSVCIHYFGMYLSP